MNGVLDAPAIDYQQDRSVRTSVRERAYLAGNWGDTNLMYGIETDEFSERWAPYAVAALRIVTALLFLEHGTARLLAFPLTEMANPPAWSIMWVAGWMEIVGSLLLIAGFRTRWVGFFLLAEMVVIYFYSYAPQSPYPLLNGGEGTILFGFIFLLLAVIGPGEWSVDKIRARNRDPVVGYEAPGGERTYDS
ncbi:MAG TPA: DoxX family protein [Sphingomicrobium sp.]